MDSANFDRMGNAILQGENHLEIDFPFKDEFCNFTMNLFILSGLARSIHFIFQDFLISCFEGGTNIPTIIPQSHTRKHAYTPAMYTPDFSFLLVFLEIGHEIRTPGFRRSVPSREAKYHHRYRFHHQSAPGR